MGVAIPLATGPYPEKDDVAEGAIDRLVTHIDWRFHHMFRRQLGDRSSLVEAVERDAARFGRGLLAPRLAELRYQLRRNGFTPDLVAECFGLYCAAVERCEGSAPTPTELAAGHALLAGGIVDIEDPEMRLGALGLAAAAHAIHGTPVHLLATSDFRAQRVAAQLKPVFDALGVGLACVGPGMPASEREAAYRAEVVCATHRDVAVAYLQDRLLTRGKSRLLLHALDDVRSSLILPGLQCALVEEADLVMLDDSYAPVTITVEADQAQERLLYEQALELARACKSERDFSFGDQGLELSAEGSTRLERLVSPLGGIWGARHRREELVILALAALHAYERGVDYAVENGRVVFPKPDPSSGDPEEPDEVLRKLLELKEGCGLRGERDVITRISVPRFFRRYVQLAGVCADARTLEEDFRVLYGLKVTGAGTGTRAVAHDEFHFRVFASVEARRAAVLETVSMRSTQAAVVVAVRTPREAQTLMENLAQAGRSVGLVRGRLDEDEKAAIASLDQPGTVVVSLFPAECNVTRTRGRGCRLHLVVAELHDSHRHVAHIARAYKADESESLLALDEEGIVSIRGTPVVARVGEDDELPADEALRVARSIQREVERSRRLTRRDLILRDEYMSDLLAFSGGRE